MRVQTADLVARLDDYLHLDRYATDDFAVIVDFCREAGIPLDKYATPSFRQRFNGLMLDNSEDLERVLCLVFPSDEVLDEVERHAARRPSLIFTHHPMDMETGGRGLLPISSEWLERLRQSGLSLYAAHAPLDCHEATSTSRALAEAIGLDIEGAFAPYFGGQAGVYGRLEPVPFARFVERVAAACGVDFVDARMAREQVERVGVVAGGAAYPPLMAEARSLGCDTYLTGDWRIRHGGPWAEANRPKFEVALKALDLNLIGASHYATEALVLRDKMVPYFRALGLDARFIPQSDSWR